MRVSFIDNTTETYCISIIFLAHTRPGYDVSRMIQHEIALAQQFSYDFNQNTNNLGPGKAQSSEESIDTAVQEHTQWKQWRINAHNHQKIEI
jgi:hypothetical protein